MRVRETLPMSVPWSAILLRLYLLFNFGMTRSIYCLLNPLSVEKLWMWIRHPDIWTAAASAVLQEGKRLFSLVESARNAEAQTARALRDFISCETRIVSELLQWITNVQVRALEDLAKYQPIVFLKAWKTSDPKPGRTSELILKAVLLRENLDLTSTLCNDGQPTEDSTVPHTVEGEP